MSGTVDERILGMKFDNTSFERGAKTTLSTLDKLKASLNFSNSTKSMNDLQNTASRFSMGGMAGSVEGVSKKFIALGAVAVTTLANITNRAVDAGINTVKALTISPIAAGLENYETKINAIQTILANTKTAGVKLSDVTDVLAELNEYANKTIYNFSEMTKNIGTFTAAGVDLKTATASIKGIANLAALSGSNSQQASTAMYQLSQAISAGQVHLQDWNSVVNAGMGGTVFQRALAQTAVAVGTLDKKSVKLVGSMKNVQVNGGAFRSSLTPPPGGTSWLTSKVLTTALSTFTGDLHAGQLAAQGFTKEQIKAIQAQAKTAVKAATQIKTISQLHQALKEEVASSWSNVWETLIGDFHSAPKLLTPLHNVLQNMFQKPAIDLNKLLKAWSALGGRTVAIQGIKQLFTDIGKVLKPIKDAFREIFPAKTGRDLYNITVAFTNFMQRIEIGADTADKLKRSFAGVFAIFHILGAVIGGVFHVFADLFGVLTNGSGSILDFTGNIGDWLVALDKALTKGGALTNFFTGLEDILRKPIQALATVKDYILTLFAGFHPSGANNVAGVISGLGSGMSGLADIIDGAWDKVNHAFDAAKKHLQPVSNAFHNFFAAIGDAFSGANFTNVLHTFNTVFLGGIGVAIARFLKGGFKVDVGGGILKKLSGALDGLTGKLEAMQTELKAKALMEVAIAIALLTASVVALSLIKPAKLEAGVKGLGIVFLELLGAMKILTSMSATSVKLPLVAASLILMAGAIDLLVIAVFALSRMSWEELKKGLTGVGVLLAEVTAAAIIISKNSKSMIAAGLGLTAMAVAINILALAVKFFGTMDWEVIKKGLIGVGGSLAVIAVGMHAMPKGMLAQGVALGLIAASLLLLARVVKVFAALDWHVIGHGLVGVGAALVTIAGAMRLMPKGMVAQAAALILISVALKGIAGAVAAMGAIDLKTMSKGLIGLGVALGELAVGLQAMRGTVRSSIALGIAAAALAIFVPTLERMGNLSIKQIATGLIAMAGAFAVIGGAGKLLASAVGPITALSFALIAFGAAMTLIGGGIYLLGKGFGYLAKNGAEGIKVLLVGLADFIAQVPAIAIALGKGLVALLKIIGENAPVIVGAFAKILDELMKAIIKELPQALKLFTKLIHTLIEAVDQNLGDLISAAFRWVLTFLHALVKKFPAIIQAGADLLVAFLRGIGKNAGRIVDAAFVTIIKFLNAIAEAIDKHEEDLLKSGAKILWAIVHGIGNAIADGGKWLWDKISGFFGWLWDKVLGWFGISSPSTLAMDIGKGIIEGVWEGIKGAGGWLWDHLTGFFGDLWGKVSGLVAGLASKISSGVSSALDQISNLTSGLGDLTKNVHFDPSTGKLVPNAKPDDSNQSDNTPNARPGGTSRYMPVIDLTQARKDAEKISKLTPALSFNHARTISIDEQSAREFAEALNNRPPEVRDIKLEQNNYSPKALGAVEIFRNTKSQLSLAKEALNA